MGKRKSAIQTLETTLIKRNHEGAIANLARLYETQGQADEPKKMLTRLTKLQPKHLHTTWL